MRAELASRVSTVRRVIDAAQRLRVTFLAAAVAYYAFVSLIPALLLLAVVATALFGEAVAAEALAVGGEFLTPAGQESVAAAIAGAAGRGGATAAGAVVLLWSTLKAFRALDTAFLEVYGVEGPVSLVDQLADAATVLFATGLGAAAMVAVGALVAAADLPPALDVAGVLALPVLLTAVFFPMYYLLPSPAVSPREALPGAVVAAVAWTLLQAGFQVYAASAGQYQVYGVIGGVLLLVTWLYLAAVVLVVGAVINVVLAAGRSPGGPVAEGWSDRQLQLAADSRTRMGEAERTPRDEETDPRGAPDVTELESEVEGLRADFEAFERDVERRTVDRPDLEAELKRYVRRRLRRGHARGWGPYLVLLYGVVLSLGAFYYLEGAWAIAGMIVSFLSTLGLYVVFVAVGIGLNALGVPGRLLDRVRD